MAIKFNQIVTLGRGKGETFSYFRIIAASYVLYTMIRINIRTFLVHNVTSLWVIVAVYVPATTDIVVFKLGGNKLSCRKGNSVGNLL